MAQNAITVKLIDAQTSQPVPFALIQNLNSDSSTSSDQEGIFKLSGKATDSIKVSNLGYETLIVSFQRLAINTTFSITPQDKLLEVIQVKGNRNKVLNVNKIEIKNLDAPVTTNSINGKILEQRNVFELGEAMKSATGVRPINRYGGFQTFRIRGFNNFVLLNDGVRDERHNLSTSAPSTNLANVERIEVLKGPASVLFGHSALGGIINVVKKKPTDIPTHEFKVTYGSFNTTNMSGGIGGNVVKDVLKYRIDFGTSQSDGWRDYGVKTNNGALALDFTPTQKDQFLISFQINDDLYDTDTGIPVDEDGYIVPNMDPTTRYNDPQDYLKHKRYDSQLKYNHEFNKDLKITNLLSYSDDDINYLSTEFLEFNQTKDSLTRAFPFYFNHTTQTVQNQLDVIYNFNTGTVKHKSVIGHSFSLLDRKTFRAQRNCCLATNFNI